MRCLSLSLEGTYVERFRFVAIGLIDAVIRQGRPAEPSPGGADWIASVSKGKIIMKTLLTALIAVGFVVGCGGDSTGAKTQTKTEVKVTTPEGTTKKTTTDTKETKVTTDKDK